MKKSRHLKRVNIKRRQGMYPEQFYLLQKGDVIKMVRSGSYRIIERIHSHSDDDSTYMIELLKLRPSWTNSKTAWYCASDAAMFAPIRVKNEKIWNITYEKVVTERAEEYRKHFDKLEQELMKKLKIVKQAESLLNFLR